MKSSHLVVLGAAVLLSACQSTPVPPRQRPYVARVSVPSRLTLHEARHLPDLEDALHQAGYRTVHGGQPAEYRLNFVIDDGPVNADTHMALVRGSEEMARSYARVGGPRIIVRRNQVIQESFDKCLTDFEMRLPAPGSRGAYQDQPANEGQAWEGQQQYEASNEPAPPAYGEDTGNPSGSGADDWQTGWSE